MVDLLSLGPSTILLSLLTGCLARQPSPAEQARLESIRQQNMAAADELKSCATRYPSQERSKTNAVPFAQCSITALKKFASLRYPDFSFSLFYKRLELAEKLSIGTITPAEYKSAFSSFAAEVNTQIQLRQNQARIAAATEQNAKATNCIAKQQKVATSSYDGVNSTSGVVATLSLLSMISDQADASQACN